MTPAGNTGSGSDWPEALCAPVRNLPPHTRLRIALSGGMDSVLLLHVAVSLYSSAAKLSVIHINHQLQTNADQTEDFCQRLCAELGVPLDVRRVRVDAGHRSGGCAGAGIEEAARNARYREFAQILTDGELLLMAHHGDDQAETVLFRLLRGTGVAGLAGMPMARTLGPGLLYRPLLDLGREQLLAWARERDLDWVEDPSNADERFDRNFLRQSVMPRLKRRWPSLTRRIGHSAYSCREADELACALAEIHFQQCADDRGALEINALGKLTLAEQKNLLRWWIRRYHQEPPVLASWQQVLADLLNAAADREPELRGHGFMVRRYRGWLHLIPQHQPLPGDRKALVPGQTLLWGEWRIRLTVVGNGENPAPEILVARRTGGERLRPAADGPSRSLKKWLQEKQIPPWERARLPLLLELEDGREKLVGAGDLWLCSKYGGEFPGSGWRIDVERQ